MKGFLNRLSAPEFQVPYLHGQVLRMPPIAPAGANPEKALYTLNWLSATGTGILVSAMLGGLLMGFRPWQLLRTYLDTIFGFVFH